MRLIARFGLILSGLRSSVPEVADWLLTVLEKLVVLVVAAGVIAGGAFLIFGDWSEAPTTRFGKVVAFLDQHWKAILLLLIPLFYLPIRRFLEELDEVRGMRRRRPQEPTETAIGKFPESSEEEESV